MIGTGGSPRQARLGDVAAAHRNKIIAMGRMTSSLKSEIITRLRCLIGFHHARLMVNDSLRAKPPQMARAVRSNDLRISRAAEAPCSATIPERCWTRSRPWRSPRQQRQPDQAQFPGNYAISSGNRSRLRRSGNMLGSARYLPINLPRPVIAMERGFSSA